MLKNIIYKHIYQNSIPLEQFAWQQIYNAYAPPKVRCYRAVNRQLTLHRVAGWEIFVYTSEYQHSSYYVCSAIAAILIFFPKKMCISYIVLYL